MNRRIQKLLYCSYRKDHTSYADCIGIYFSYHSDSTSYSRIRNPVGVR